MKIPNFFIVGAGKAGTTSLYYYFKQHPDIYMSPIKEPNYFAKDTDINEFIKRHKGVNTFIKDFNEYIQLFKDRKKEKVVGEASVSYLYSKVAAAEIFKYNPNAKILIILRDPIERAFSQYLMNLMIGLTTEKNFIKEVVNDYKNSKGILGSAYLYIEFGLYYEQVKRYLDIFPKKNVKILLFEDLKNNLENTLKNIFVFLDVDSNVKIDITPQNPSYVPRIPPSINKFILKWGRNLKPIIPSNFWNEFKNFYRKIFFENQKPVLSEKDRKYLLPFFEQDIKKTQELIQRDLSSWLK
ncbi:sulfotransferase family protein [Hydrogenothermus marinus]|uniref:Sulfotransferase domain-containing protein n=1 Tax=Hydrogenothermus marinus TaxID=133270 RepID=A0A3M0B9Q4_9AQUI|nr:sulfotransferase [Hydrogenothermus marinus]RMA93316.1 sulfotransferase domain-containing protein [Hydrogenothermus marinus]